jgi:oxygen-dependent protoporphyrinogen oxidase
MSKRIAVIGGGISGLSAANTLIGAGHEVHIFEASDRLGGKLWSEHVDGFLIESGADSFVASRPRIVKLCEKLGLGGELMPPVDPNRRAFIYRGGALYPIPEGFTGLVPTRFQPMMRSRLLSPLGKIRLLAELRIPANTSPGDESLASFATRRFGKEAYERLLEPLLAGISAADGKEMSLAASFPQWKTAELEYGSVIKGITASKPGKTEHPRTSGFLSLRNGMSTLVEALVSRLANNGIVPEMHAPVERVTQVGTAYHVHFEGRQPLRFDAVIVAVPAWNAASILQSIVPGTSLQLRAIPQRSSALVSLGYHDPSIVSRLRGTGYLIPAVARRLTGGTTWSSSKWSNRAPEGSALIRVYIGRGKGQAFIAQGDDVLIDVARTELRETLGIVAEPAVQRVTTWIDSMPQYTLGHLDRVAEIEQTISSHPGLALAGNFLRGVGIPICIQTGESAAEKVLGSLRDS